MLDGEPVSMTYPTYEDAATHIAETWKKCEEINVVPRTVYELHDVIKEILGINLPDNSFIVQPFHIDVAQGLRHRKQRVYQLQLQHDVGRTHNHRG